MSDDAQHEHTFDSTDAGASLVTPMQCSALRKNGYVCIKSRPCKIVDMSTSKTGKHGHAKVHLVAIDIFTAKKLEDLCPSTHNMDVPIVKTDQYMLMSVSEDGYLNLMDESTGATTEHIRVPDNEVGQKIKDAAADIEAGNVEATATITSAMGEQHCTKCDLKDV
ncbi:Uu.00g023670.m01.CDS01 [Anthostomella pinea]|uniref:Eukaryotic translation initiation factor 5A n=1 Tax=Anthostomella pinea TaxID=933095 RepID=A0AAI8W1B1_9PEZI|nr:Uu.00g023670.m01.CDS01 [Anthostomella pinea]